MKKKRNNIFYLLLLIINTLIFCVLVINHNKTEIPLYILFIIFIAIIFITIKICKYNENKRTKNLFKLSNPPKVGKIYEITKILDCFDYIKTNNASCFRVLAKEFKQKNQEQMETFTLYAWFENIYLKENNEPVIGIYIGSRRDNFCTLGGYFLKPIKEEYL
ncbi:MAG: hypothetical protein WC264_00830 [Candidatus Paceibacterota bacterium]|jgi:hypothetical protein